ncbi:MAG: hypothetical protein HC831_02330 [Chloroflexia bacterium]|nr:hypothetical protein [Chloroflexia bacterium]
MGVTIDTIKENKEKIANLIETFSKAIQKKNCGAEVLELLHGISFYSEQFFIAAGLLLEKYEILSFEKHEIRHMEFVKDLMQFQERLEKGESMLAFDLYDYVKNWFEDYLQGTENEILDQVGEN